MSFPCKGIFQGTVAIDMRTDSGSRITDFRTENLDQSQPDQIIRPVVFLKWRTRWVVMLLKHTNNIIIIEFIVISVEGSRTKR